MIKTEKVWMEYGWEMGGGGFKIVPLYKIIWTGTKK
jgi:hypothetical protein